MDPKAALVQCDQLISDMKLSDAREWLANYRTWRRGGGFEPLDVYGRRGDAFADDCERRISDASL